ncbi:CAP domain-containing protein [Lacrimispora saccharolytica]|nr:CAP domain-containing protein [Lacrimispora saccharolytica]
MKTLKNLLTTMFTMVFLFTFFHCVNASAAENPEAIINVPITVQEEYSKANEFFQLLNQKRTTAGLPEYQLDSGLTEMAMTRAAQLCIYFSHASMISDPKEHDALGDLQQGTPVQNSLYVMEDIAEGTADAKSTYTVWYNSLTHRPLLISTKGKYCGIGVVTYHNNIKWCLIVSNDPCGKTITGLSGAKEVTRNISAKAKYFSKNIYRTITANANSNKCGNDGFVNELFVFADISGQSCGYYVTESDIFNFKSNDPDLFEVDSLGRIKPLKTGIGSMTVSYNGLELHTVSVKTTEKRKIETEQATPKPTETPSQSGSTNQTEPKDQTENSTPATNPPNQSESKGQTTIPKQTEAKGQTTVPNQTEIKDQTTVPNQTEAPKANPQPLTVKMKNVTYNGKAQKPAVAVYLNGKKLAKKYYSVKYKNNKNVGYGIVTVKGKGKYAKYYTTGTFQIKLKKVSLSSVKAGKKKLTAAWKKTGGNQGYQIQYSKAKNFADAKILNVSAGKKSMVLKNLESKKKYYVRIRSYKKVNNKEIWYTGWSKAKSTAVK